MPFTKLNFKIITLLILFSFKPVFSQNLNLIDSLEIENLKKQNIPTLVENYYLLAREYRKLDIKKTIEINNKIWGLSKKK